MAFPSHNLTHRGRTLPISQWAEESGIPAATIRSRLKLGWSLERTLTTPPNRQFARGGRRKKDAPRPCPPLKKRGDDQRAYCQWSENGREYTRSFSPWGSDECKRAYRRFQLEWAARATDAPGPEGVSVGRLIVRWLQHCEATYRKRDRPTSEVHCNRAAMQPLAEFYGDEPAAEFTPPKLRVVREAMIEKGWKRATVNAQVGRIVRAFAWGVTELLVPVGVHAALALLEPLVAGRRADVGEGDGVSPVPEKHWKAVLAGKHLHPDAGRRAVLAAMIRVQLLTGMRPGELCSLAAGDIDRAKKPWRYEVSAFNKMLHRDTRRVVYFGPQARTLLAPFIARAGGGLVFMLPAARKGAAPSALTPRRYRDYVHAACDSAKVPRWSPNQLRHNRATELMDRYEDDRAAAAVLGNSPEVARQVYAERAGESVARRIAEATG